MAVRLGIKTLAVILYDQQHVLMTERELDQHLASSTMLHSITHRFLSNPVHLSRHRRTDWQKGAIRFNRASHSATFADVHGQRLQGRFQIAHSVSAFEASRGESRLSSRFISESHDRGRLLGFGRSVRAQLFLKQLCAQCDADELLPYSVVQVIGDSTLFAGATLDHLTFEPRALRDLSLKKRCFLLPEPFKFTALVLRQHLCFFSRRDVQADSRKPARLTVFVHLHSPARADPLHTAVRLNNPKLCLVIFALLDRVIHGLPDFVTIAFVPTGNQLFECDPSSRRKTQLRTARRRNPDFILCQIPLPHSEVSGVRGEVESFLADFQFTGETGTPCHIPTQLVPHRGHNGRVREGKEERRFNNPPDDHGNVARQDRTKNHTAADEQRASPITTPPDGNRGSDRKNKQQKEGNLTKQTPWIRDAGRH